MRVGKYVSVWQDGEVAIETKCEYDLVENMIENVETVGEEEIENCHELTNEYVEDTEGNQYPICMECHEKFLKVRMVENEFNSTILEEETYCPDCGC